MDLKDIHAMALLVHELYRGGETKEALQRRFSEFERSLPALFNMCCRDTLDTDNLDTLLRLSKQLRDGSVSHEDAIMQFGAHMLPKSTGAGAKNT